MSTLPVVSQLILALSIDI